MTAIEYIAERRVEQAIEDGLFSGLPAMGYVDCSLSGERFVRAWFDGLERRWQAADARGHDLDVLCDADRRS